VPRTPKVWVALNGLEFSPNEADGPVLWPWAHVKMVPKQGPVLLDHAGRRVKGVVVSCPGLLRALAATLQARALRDEMKRGESRRFVCTSREEYGLAIGGLSLAVISGAGALWGHQPTFDFWALAALSLALSALFLRAAMRRNVDELTIDARGVQAVFKDGRKLEIPWRDIHPRNGVRAGEIRSINGVVLRFPPRPELRTALRAGRRKTGGFREGRRYFARFLWRLYALAVFTGALCGAAGALIVQSLGLPAGTTPTPTWVFTRMTGVGILIGGMLPLQVWLGACLDKWLMPAGVKLYSRAPRAPQTLEPAAIA
jgi:hypothetical protein